MIICFNLKLVFSEHFFCSVFDYDAIVPSTFAIVFDARPQLNNNLNFSLMCLSSSTYLISTLRKIV